MPKFRVSWDERHTHEVEASTKGEAMLKAGVPRHILEGWDFGMCHVKAEEIKEGKNESPN